MSQGNYESILPLLYSTYVQLLGEVALCCGVIALLGSIISYIITKNVDSQLVYALYITRFAALNTALMIVTLRNVTRNMIVDNFPAIIGNILGAIIISVLMTRRWKRPSDQHS